MLIDATHHHTWMNRRGSWREPIFRGTMNSFKFTIMSFPSISLMILLAVLLSPCTINPTNGLLVRPFYKTLPHNSDTCECECCYKVGALMHTECVPADYTSFSVPRCANCTVSTCVEKYPISCNQPTSVVTTKCSSRNSLFSELIVFCFMLISVSLLFYGCFFKKYDGYHPVSHSERVMRNRPILDYNATNRPLLTQSRAGPTLPSISENQELRDSGQG